jgi:hypothetical protein
MHGGAAGSGAPVGNRNALRHGGYTAEAIALRREIRALLRDSREIAESMWLAGCRAFENTANVWKSRLKRRLQEDAARPMIFDYRLGTCRSRAVHGITIMVNSLFNGWRFEDAWLGQ